MPDTVLRTLGWRSLLINGDPCVLDRWLWLRRHLRTGNVRTFDAGCGNGAFAIYAAEVGNQVLAASFSEREQEDARRRAGVLGVEGIQFRILDLREIEDHRAELGTFDQIVCLETIEHVSDDEGLLTSLAALLKPGGQLLLTAPFDGHHPLYTEERYPSGVEDGSHVRYGYSARRLREIAEQAGLEVRSEGFVSGVILTEGDKSDAPALAALRASRGVDDRPAAAPAGGAGRATQPAAGLSISERGAVRLKARVAPRRRARRQPAR